MSPEEQGMSESAAVENRPPGHSGRTIAKNAFFITLGSTALKLVNFAFSVYVVRSLGDDRYGRYSIVIAFAGLFQIFAELGMSQYVMREIARDRSRTRLLFWNLAAVRFLLALLAIVGITAAGALVGYSPDIVLGIFIYSCSFVLASLYAPLETVLKANERFDYVSSLTVLGQLVFELLGTIVLRSGMGFLWL